MSEFKFPTEEIDLPSKGLLYPKDNPLSSGKIEMKYMTAKEEDILTNPNYITKGTVIDKLLQSLIITKVDYNDLIVGDQNAIMVAARILGYGKDYEFQYAGESQTVDLTTLEDKIFDESLITPHTNEFSFTLPHSKVDITFKILTIRDSDKIKRELEGLKKINKDNNSERSTRLKYTITSVDADREAKTIREFVDTALLARDARAFRNYVNEVQPNLDLKVTVETRNGEEDVELPITATFFWPE
tara:strand:- start:232 stop:963 length:732 start_codon:yes stop_codon:yes gene_type:complete